MPVADFTIDDTLQCFSGHNFVFEDLSYISSGLLTRQWLFGDTTTSVNSPVAKQYANPGTYTVTLKAIGSEGCTDSLQRKVYVIEMPLANVNLTGGDTVFCEGGSASLQASINAAYSYQWKRDGNIIPAAMADSYTADQTGNYYVVVTVNGCSDSSVAIPVIENPKPVTSAITGDGVVDEGTMHTYRVTPAGSLYRWVYTNGVGGSVSDSIRITWNTWEPLN